MIKLMARPKIKPSADTDTAKAELAGAKQAIDALHFEDIAAERVRALDPDTNLLTFGVTFNLMRMATRVGQALEADVHGPAGWSMAGFRAMFVVWVADELAPNDIARLSGLSRAAVSSVLNTLERDGLVERSRESSDRRVVTVRLTPSGRRRLTKAYLHQNRNEAELLAGLSAKELQQLNSLLRRLIAPRRT